MDIDSDVQAKLVLVQKARPLDVELPVLFFERAALFSFEAVKSLILSLLSTINQVRNTTATNTQNNDNDDNNNNISYSDNSIIFVVIITIVSIVRSGSISYLVRGFPENGCRAFS